MPQPQVISRQLITAMTSLINPAPLMPTTTTLQHTHFAKILEHISEWKSVGHFVLLGSGSLDDSGTLIPNSCKSKPQDVRRFLNECKKHLGYSHWIARAFSIVPQQNMIELSYDTSLIPCYWHVFTQACREKDPDSVFSYSRRSLNYARYRWRRYGSFASITACNIESAEQIAIYLSMPDPGIDGVFPRCGDRKPQTLLFGRGVARAHEPNCFADALPASPIQWAIEPRPVPGQ